MAGHATSFIHTLKLHPRMYCQFLQVMKDYSTHKLNVEALVSQLETLFQFHPDLLAGYRIFLHPQLQTRLPSPPESAPESPPEKNLEILKPHIDFMNKLQKRFANKQGVIREYVETIRLLKQGKLGNREAYDAITIIFGKENEDLIDEFEFLLFDRKETRNGKKKEEKKKNSIEDKMFELDINLSRRKTTEDSAKKLMYSLQQQQYQMINIDHYFSAVSLGYIKKLYKEEGRYKEKGSSIITKLQDDPRGVLPQILKKLESEEEVLIRKWRDIHEKKKNPVTKSSM